MQALPVMKSLDNFVLGMYSQGRRFLKLADVT